LIGKFLDRAMGPFGFMEFFLKSGFQKTYLSTTMQSLAVDTIPLVQDVLLLLIWQYYWAR
jgi:hypothetical protein